MIQECNFQENASTSSISQRMQKCIGQTMQKFIMVMQKCIIQEHSSTQNTGQRMHKCTI